MTLAYGRKSLWRFTAFDLVRAAIEDWQDMRRLRDRRRDEREEADAAESAVGQTGADDATRDQREGDQ
jgi:Arc/MetJ-type ribon-helix-helix transcriptional regulator